MVNVEIEENLGKNRLMFRKKHFHRPSDGWIEIA
jgi:hypothetical protein